MKSLGGIAATGLKALTAGTAAAVTGIAALGTAAIKSYADYEQLVGGVETLFGAGGKTVEQYAISVGKSLKQVSEVQKDYNDLILAQETVLENASNAYKTAGLSQNQYMESVTSFAASLKQSTANELEAAKAADQAIIDMADNANKMGTSMESIQNAYQGFAKQNYTMLDNLKLGYGGTKEEMQRLLADAEKLSGIKYDMGSLADVYEAIHVVQTELGITGTTAKEASTTISGSIGMMKASWENFVSGLADKDADFSTLSDSVADSFSTVVDNIMPVAQEILPSIVGMMEYLVPLVVEEAVGVLGEVAPGLISTGIELLNTVITMMIDYIPTIINEGIPFLIESGILILSSIMNGLIDNFPTIVESVKNVISYLYDVIVKEGPALLEAGYTILSDLISGFVEGIPEVLPKILDFVQGLGDTLAEQAPIWIERGFEMLSMLVEGIISAFPILVERVPEIISTFANIINDNFPTILLKGVELVWQLITGLLSAIPTIVENIPQIIRAIVDTIMAFQWLNLGGNIIKFFADGIKSMGVMAKGAMESIQSQIVTIIQNLPSFLSNIGKNSINGLGNAIISMRSFITTNASKIVTWIVDILKQLPGKVVSIGSDLIRGLWNGISNMTGWILDKIGGFASDVISKVKGIFGVQSPSKEFRYIGEMCVAGFDDGIEDLMDPSGISRNINASLSTMKNNVEGAMAYGTNNSNTPDAQAGLTQNIYINKEISTADEMARAIRLESKYGLMKGVALGY